MHWIPRSPILETSVAILADQQKNRNNENLCSILFGWRKYNNPDPVTSLSSQAIRETTCLSDSESTPRLTILRIGMQYYYTDRKYAFMRQSIKKLLLKFASIYKLQFYNIDKLRHTMISNSENKTIVSLDQRKIIGT